MDRSTKHLRERVAHMVDRCHEEKMNVTPQRMAIYRALLQSEDHPTPEMLYRIVSRKMPSLSLATIYKTLDALETIGLVRAVAVDTDKRRYDANDSPHHHLICSSCGSIRDYYSNEFDALVPSRPVQGFVPWNVSVNITGVCTNCRHKGKRVQA